MAKVWRVARWVIAFLIIAYAIDKLLPELSKIRSITFDFHVGWLAASVLLILFTYWIQASSWRLMVTGWGAHLGKWQGLRIWVISSMGKYLPLKIWAVAGMTIMSKRAGITPWIATASAIILQVISIGAGVFVIAWAGIPAISKAYPAVDRFRWLFLLGTIGSIAVVVYPTPLNWLLRKFKLIAGELRPPKLGPIILGFATNFAAWCLFGISLIWMMKGSLPQVDLPVREAIGAFTISYLAGFITPLPGGIGSREMAIVVALEGVLDPIHAAALAALSRIMMTVADLLAAAPFMIIREKTGETTD